MDGRMTESTFSFVVYFDRGGLAGWLAANFYFCKLPHTPINRKKKKKMMKLFILKVIPEKEFSIELASAGLLPNAKCKNHFINLNLLGDKLYDNRELGPHRRRRRQSNHLMRRHHFTVKMHRQAPTEGQTINILCINSDRRPPQ